MRKIEVAQPKKKNNASSKLLFSDSVSSFISRFMDEVVQSLADGPYQERVWARGEGNEVDS